MHAPTARATANDKRLWPSFGPAAASSTADDPMPTADLSADPDWSALEAAAAAEADPAAIETEAAASPEHEARLERLDDLHRRQVAEAGRRIAETKKQLREAQAQYEAERLALERRWQAAMAEGEAAIEADERLAAKCRAFLGE